MLELYTFLSTRLIYKVAKIIKIRLYRLDNSAPYRNRYSYYVNCVTYMISHSELRRRMDDSFLLKFVQIKLPHICEEHPHTTRLSAFAFMDNLDKETGFIETEVLQYMEQNNMHYSPLTKKHLIHSITSIFKSCIEIVLYRSSTSHIFHKVNSLSLSCKRTLVSNFGGKYFRYVYKNIPGKIPKDNNLSIGTGQALPVENYISRKCIVL